MKTVRLPYYISDTVYLHTDKDTAEQEVIKGVVTDILITTDFYGSVMTVATVKAENGTEYPDMQYGLDFWLTCEEATLNL